MTVSARRSALFFRARMWLCALPLDAVLESLRPLPVTALAAAPDFVLGAALVRGTPTMVVDAGLLLGVGGQAAPGRFILLRAGTRPVALAVESVLGVRDIPPGMDKTAPPLLRDAAVIAALGRLDGELLLVLEAARLLADMPYGLLQEATA